MKNYLTALLLIAVSVSFSSCRTVPMQEESICAVHQIQMKKQTLPINYGLIDMFHPFYTARHELFPNDERYLQGGCVVEVDAPTEKEVYVCPKCTQAQLVYWKTMLEIEERAVEKYKQEQMINQNK